MGKLECTCGHIIVDQTDNITYKGYILPDTLVDKISDALTENIDELAEATNANKRLEWIKKKFGVPPYPTDLNDSSMIYDLLTGVVIQTTQDIFECENCGRIAIQIGNTNRFKFFSPDTDDTKGILNGSREHL